MEKDKPDFCKGSTNQMESVSRIKMLQQWKFLVLSEIQVKKSTLVKTDMPPTEAFQERGIPFRTQS